MTPHTAVAEAYDRHTALVGAIGIQGAEAARQPRLEEAVALGRTQSLRAMLLRRKNARLEHKAL